MKRKFSIINIYSFAVKACINNIGFVILAQLSSLFAFLVGVLLFSPWAYYIIQYGMKIAERAESVVHTASNKIQNISFIRGLVALGNSYMHAFEAALLLYGLFLILFIVVLSSLITIGWWNVGLRWYAHTEARISMLFRYWSYVISYLLLHIVLRAIIGGGYSLLILPGFLLEQRFRFAPLFMVDQNFSVFDSLRQSWRLTVGQTWYLAEIAVFEWLLFLLPAFMWLLLPFLFVVFYPLHTLATVALYKALQKPAEKTERVTTIE